MNKTVKRSLLSTNATMLPASARLAIGTFSVQTFMIGSSLLHIRQILKLKFTDG
jgi:hypothetical protein